MIIPYVHPVPHRFRLAKSLRKLLPDNPIQIIFLVSAVCLSACIGRSWLVLPSMPTLDAIGPLSSEEIARWVRVTQFFALPLLVAGVGAYSRCFLRREKVMESWRGLVIAPAIFGITGGFFVPALILRPRSVLERTNGSPFHAFRFPIGTLILNHGVGFQLALVGLLLALLGGWLLRRGVVSLPVQFGPPSFPTATGVCDQDIARQRLFAIYVLSLFGVVGGLLSLPLSPLLIQLFSHTSSNELRYSFSLWFYAAHSFLYALPMFVLAVWTLGDHRRKKLLEWARLRSMRILGFAILLPIAVFWLPHVIAYAIDRVQWAQRWSVSPEAPLPILYLHIPRWGHTS